MKTFQDECKNIEEEDPVINAKNQKKIDNNSTNVTAKNSHFINNINNNSQGITLESLTSSEMRENNINFDSGFVSIRNDLENLNVNVKFSNN